MKKALVTLIIASITLLSLSACGSSSSTQTAGSTNSASEEASAPESTAGADESVAEESAAEESAADESLTDTSSVEEAEDEENYNTGDASADNPRNQDDIGENELLVVSFGTSYNDSRVKTIGAIENALEKAFPDWSVRRAFTSQIIIDHVKERDGEEIDNVKTALDRAVNNGVKNLVVQPTHLMDGLEYHELFEEIEQYADAFSGITIANPLLMEDEDFSAVEKAITDATASYDDGETAIVFMGHGTEAESNDIYSLMHLKLKNDGFSHYYVGTVEASPSVDDVLKMVKEESYKRVVLRPLMVVAGDHANNDMAGDEEDSWKSIFEAEGYEVECVLEGLGSLESIQNIYVEHTKLAMEKHISE